MILIPAASREYVTVPITAKEAGQYVDISTGTVEFAFTPETDTPPTNWFPGSWVGIPPNLEARVLVGPDTDFPLEPGEYAVWVRVTFNAERPVRNAGRLILTES